MGAGTDWLCSNGRAVPEAGGHPREGITMDYYNNGLPPVPGQSQQQGAQAAPTQAVSRLNSVPQVENTQSYAHTGTTQQPYGERKYYGQASYGYASPRHYAEVPRQTYAKAAVAPQRKASSGKGASLFLGIAGGLVGATGLVAALALTGAIRFGGTATTQQNTALQTSSAIQISADSEDITVAEAVAAKATPSVCAVYCQFAEGAGMGSGVILDASGNILTNYHVVDGATDIYVTIDGKDYDATIVGTDSSSDLAVIHAELGSDIVTPMEIGDSSALNVGDWVMTVGSPFGLEQSCSQGIVSSLYRNELMTSSTGNTIYANLIQVDAAINPGNSGGALVNSQGQLVGICTLYSSDTQSFAGIGFAIPGNYAIDIANKIIAGEKVTHAYIGVSMQTVTPETAQANNLAVDAGAYVAEAVEGSPAAKAGIQEGDVIISLGGEKITSADEVIVAVRSHSIGETVEVTVIRGDEELTFKVTLADDTALQESQKTESNGGTGYDNYYDDQQYDYDYNDNYEEFLEELFNMMGDNEYGNGYGGNGYGGNGYGYPYGN